MTLLEAQLLKKGNRVYVVEHKVSQDDPDVYVEADYFFESLNERKYNDHRLILRKGLVPGFEFPIAQCRTREQYEQHMKAKEDADNPFGDLSALYEPKIHKVTIQEAEPVLEDFSQPDTSEVMAADEDEVGLEIKKIKEAEKEKIGELGGLFTMVGQQGVGITEKPIQEIVDEVAKVEPEVHDYELPPAMANIITDSVYEPKIKSEEFVGFDISYKKDGVDYMVNVIKGDSVFGEHGITSIPSASVDLIATDPPFGMEFQSNFRVVKHKKIANDDNLVFLPQFFKESYRILKENSHMYCFCSWHHIDTFVSEARKVFGKKGLRNILIWEKEHQGMGDLEQLGMSYELILFLEKGHRQHDYMRDGNILKFVSTKNKLHPTQKPVDLMQFLIYISSKPGDTVADFFSGSGSTGIAAINEGRNVILYEMDDVHYPTVVNRVTHHIKHPEMFTSGMFRENKTKVDKYIDAIKKDYEIRLKEREYEERTLIINAIKKHLIDDPSRMDYNKFLLDLLLKLEPKE